MNMISNMIPKRLESFLMFCAASLASALEHNIQNTASPGFGHQRLMGLGVCGLIGLCSDAIPSDIHHYREGGNPTGAGISPIFTAGDKGEKGRLAELHNIMGR